MKEKYCSGCGNVRKIADFYYSNSYVNRHSESVQLCKECIWGYVSPEYENLYDMSKIKDILRMIDKPFIHSLWEASVIEADKSCRDYFKTYMKNVAMRQNRVKTWNDSEFDNAEENETGQITTKNEDELADITEADMTKWRRFWGDDSVTGYLFMEDFYSNYITNFPTETPAQINIYKNLAKIHRQAEKFLELGKTKEYKEFMELSSKLHNDANIKPIQSTGANDDKGLSTYGLWIKEIEKEEPCEFFEKKPIYEDFDGTKSYFDKWILRPMKNIFGQSRDFDVGDDK